MNTTTGTKPTDAGTLPKRDPKTGQFEKGKAKTVKPAAPKATTTTKPVAPKATTTVKPAAPMGKKP